MFYFKQAEAIINCFIYSILIIDFQEKEVVGSLY